MEKRLIKKIMNWRVIRVENPLTTCIFTYRPTYPIGSAFEKLDYINSVYRSARALITYYYINTTSINSIEFLRNILITRARLSIQLLSNHKRYAIPLQVNKHCLFPKAAMQKVHQHISFNLH